MQDRSPPARRSLLRRTAGPYIWVRSGGEGRICAKSAYLSGADPNQCRCDVRTVPQPDISSRRLSACGYARLCPIDSESQNAMQQVRISETVMLSCCRELLALRDFGIRICFDEI